MRLAQKASMFLVWVAINLFMYTIYNASGFIPSQSGCVSTKSGLCRILYLYLRLVVNIFTFKVAVCVVLSHLQHVGQTGVTYNELK